MLYEWRMSPEVRAKSLNKDEFNYEEHKTWFNRFINDRFSLGYILEADGVPAAQIRFDKTKIEGYYNISIFTAPNMQGKGYGNEILKLSTKDERLLKVAKFLVAEVLDDNFPSKKLFLKNDFIQSGETIVNQQRVLLFKKRLR